MFSNCLFKTLQKTTNFSFKFSNHLHIIHSSNKYPWHNLSKKKTLWVAFTKIVLQSHFRWRKHCPFPPDTTAPKHNTDCNTVGRIRMPWFKIERLFLCDNGSSILNSSGQGIVIFPTNPSSGVIQDPWINPSFEAVDGGRGLSGVGQCVRER